MSLFIRPIEQKILALIESEASLSDLEIARKLKMQVHNVRYALSNMEQSKLITKTALVNVSGLGLFMHNIFFCLAAEQQKRKFAILEAIQKDPRITWLGEFGGDYQYGLGIAVANFHEVRDFLEKLSTKFGRVFFEKQISYQYHALRYARKYLSSKNIKDKGLKYYSPIKKFNYDEQDLKILKAMQEHGNLSDRALALKLNIPLSTLKLRISKLEKAEVITGYIYVVDYPRLGVQQYKFLLYSRGYSAEFRMRLTNWCATHRNVVGFLECFGAWDFEINLEVEQQGQVISITQELYETFGDELNLIKTLTRFRNIKLVSLPEDL